MARSSKTTASKSGGGIKARGRPSAKKTAAPRKKKLAASTKRISKRTATRKRTPAKTAASKSRAIAGGGKARGRTAAKSTSRAPKTASKRAASASRKRSTGKRASSRSGAKKTRRTENVNLGAAVTNPVTEAMTLGTEVVAGAIQAGGDIAAATADMAMSAARTAAAVTTGVVPEELQEDEAGSKHERQRGGVRRGS